MAFDFSLNRNPSHRYTINAQHRAFQSGQSNLGQVLIGIWFPDLVAILFDPNGEFLEFQTRRMSENAKQEGANHFYSRTFRHLVNDELQCWKAEIGFAPGPIRIAKVSCPEIGFQIQDSPEYAREIVESPENHSPEDVQNARSLLREWADEDKFVLQWGNDFWLNGEGEVTAS